MQLATYISDLLYRYECVIVPGFGAFITQYQSARVDTVTHEFYPPGKSVMFNRQLQTNDGILANYVASVENCDYTRALQKIRNFTGSLSLQLSEGKTVTVANVGDFYLNEERTVQFQPSATGNFNTASFGLSPMNIANISRETNVETAKVSEEKTPILFTPEKRTTFPYLKYAAIGLVAITLAGFGGMKLYENNVQEYNFAERQKAETMVESQIQEATFVIENPLSALTITVPKQKGKYHVVAGAFRIESNAEKKVAQLAEQGFSAKLIGANKYGLHQVVYSSHEDRLEALRALRTIKNTQNKDAWLLVKDLTK
ncbi:SPOR domain-containing protein [Rasiella rasia]|uniref:SPOR domain-containing protein n=2 Tax=Rasiella rasia TaxID=2744027 RepID=A0A6G6GQN7_9FLAO|nr:SPOR domain-containing protein [Rasiella rasia]